MGNAIGVRKKVKVMKINGETFKIKTPVRAWEVVKDHPSHVLLESEAVMQFGLRAKPIEPDRELKPKKIYFLVELPKLHEEEVPRRRARSGVHTTAKDQLEWLVLSRRSVSDLSITKPMISVGSGGSGSSSGPVRVKVRMPKTQLAKIVEGSSNEAEVAEKIVDLYMDKAAGSKRKFQRS